MKKIVFFILLVILSVFAFSYQYTFYDLGTAHKVSLIENKPLIIYFSSPSCMYCKKFENEVLSQESLQEILRAAYIFVKINPNTNTTIFMGEEFANNDLFGAFGVRGTPTFVFWYKDKGITSIPGYMPLNDFKKALMYILRFIYEDYKESFEVYSQKNDFYLGPSEVLTVSKDDFEFIIQNDKNTEYVEKTDNIKDFDAYKTFLTNSTEIANQLIKLGALKILVLGE